MDNSNSNNLAYVDRANIFTNLNTFLSGITGTTATFTNNLNVPYIYPVADGSTYVSTITPDTNSNDNTIATTSYVKTLINGITGITQQLNTAYTDQANIFTQLNTFTGGITGTNIYLSGGVTAATATFLGGFTGTTATFTGGLTGSGIYLSGGITAATATFTGGLTGTTATFTGGVTTSGLLYTSGGISGTTATFTGGLTGNTAFFSGGLTGTTATFTGGLTGTGIYLSGGITAATATFLGGFTGTTATFTGGLTGTGIHLSGGITAATATFLGGLTGTGIYLSGGITAATATFLGGLTGTNATFTGGLTGTGIYLSGGITAATATFLGGLTGTGIYLSGGITAATATFLGGLTGTTATFTGGLTGTGIHLSGGITAATATFLGGLTGTGIYLSGGITAATATFLGGLTGTNATFTTLNCNDANVQGNLTTNLTSNYENKALISTTGIIKNIPTWTILSDVSTTGTINFNIGDTAGTYFDTTNYSKIKIHFQGFATPISSSKANLYLYPLVNGSVSTSNMECAIYITNRTTNSILTMDTTNSSNRCQIFTALENNNLPYFGGCITYYVPLNGFRNEFEVDCSYLRQSVGSCRVFGSFDSLNTTSAINYNGIQFAFTNLGTTISQTIHFKYYVEHL